MLRLLTWLVARLLLFTVCILLFVIFNFAVFSLHLVLLFLWAVSKADVFTPVKADRSAAAGDPIR